MTPIPSTGHAGDLPRHRTVPPTDLLDPEQTLNLLDHLTWSDDLSDGHWQRAARYVADRLPDRPEPTAETCRRTAAPWVSTGTRPTGFGRTTLYRAKYDLLAEILPHARFTFMNMGYLEADGGADPHGNPFDDVGSGPATLYRTLLDHVEPAGGDVLDLGCGRGGGSALVAGLRRVDSVVGLDLAPRNVAFCQRVHRAEGLRFHCGDAARLPFDDACFDLVLAVESAHCFEALDESLAEARRVLRPDGRLVFADEWPADSVPELEVRMRGAGFRVVELADITTGVVRSIDALPPRVTRLLAALPQGPVRDAYQRFFRTRIGSDSAQLYRSGRCSYLRLIAVPRP